MKYAKLFFTSIIFFILINTSFFISGLLGFLALPCAVLMFVLFLVLFGYCCYYVVLMIKERFQDKYRNILVVTLVIVLGLTVYKPEGLLSYELLNGKRVMYAFSEGAANCTTNLDLYSNNIFTFTDICFGVYTTLGKYRINSDTIFFEKIYIDKRNDFYEYAVYSDVEHYYLKGKEGVLQLYRKQTDTVPAYVLFVLDKSIFK